MNNDLRSESFTDYLERIITGLAGVVMSIVFLVGGLGITGVFAWALYELVKQGAPLGDLLLPAGVFIVAGIVLHLINMAIILFSYRISPRQRGGEYDRLAQAFEYLEARHEELYEKHYFADLGDDGD